MLAVLRARGTTPSSAHCCGRVYDGEFTSLKEDSASHSDPRDPRRPSKPNCRFSSASASLACLHRVANVGNMRESGRARARERERASERERESARAHGRESARVRQREQERDVEVDRPASRKAQRQTTSKTLPRGGHRTSHEESHSSWPRLRAVFCPLPPCGTRPRTRRASRHTLPRADAPAVQGNQANAGGGSGTGRSARSRCRSRGSCWRGLCSRARGLLQPSSA